MATLSRAQVAAYAQQAGFGGQALDVAVAIAQAESSFVTTATHQNSNGTTDYGLWQINSSNGYDPVQLLNDPAYNAAAAYAIYRAWNNTFNAWTTFVSGVWRQYLPASSGSTSAPDVKSAASNTYPKGQCTWWANERYHALSGYYVPWSANAKGWAADAQDAGWSVSNKPLVPSIIVLQPGVQGADPMFGHVAVVESVNKDGSLHCSTQNWNNITYPNITYWDFKTGAGVQFVYAGAGLANGGTATLSDSTGNGGQISFTPFLKQIHNTLVDTPGFYGVALALDEAEQFTGWVDLSNAGSNGGVLGWLTGTQFDFVGFTRSLGATISDNAVPFAIRYGIASLGFILIIFLLLRVAMGVAENGLEIAKDVAPLAAAL
jgi:surface antigen